MSKMKPYVVRQGDYVAKLAHTMRFDADAVWEDDANRALRERRPNPNMLAPGDVVRVPVEPTEDPLDVAVGRGNRFKVEVPRMKVSIVVRDEEEPLQDAPYIIDGLGKRVVGRSDGDGRVTFEAPVQVREVRLVFYEKRLAFHVRIGDLDPIEEGTGIYQRLAHLGFDGWALGEAASLPRSPVEAGNPAAIRAFQRACGLEETGITDETTRAALHEAHGS